MFDKLVDLEISQNARIRELENKLTELKKLLVETALPIEALSIAGSLDSKTFACREVREQLIKARNLIRQEILTWGN